MDFKKSYHASRLHLVISIILVLLLMGFLLRFFDMIQASLEEASVDINLLSLQQWIHFQDLLTRSKNSQCKFLDNPILFKNIGYQNKSAESESIPGTWHYNAKNHKITYNVRSKSYLRSEIEQKIIIDLYCKEGKVVFKERSFRWCRDKKIWGCSEW